MAYLQQKTVDLEKVLENSGDTFLTITKIKDKQADLKKEQLQWKTTQHIINSLEMDNRQLRKMLRLRTRSRYLLIPAEVIGRSPENWFSYLTLNRGSAAGLKKNLPVINEEGLVGKIVEVGPNYCKVLTITAPQSRISIMDLESRDLGIAQGRLHHPLKLNYIANTATVKKEDRIITSGISNIFPKGLLVGMITKVKKEKYNVFQKVEVSPAVNFSKLHYVFILTGRKRIVYEEK
ncbi:rod shape-determining protein MreC [Candidatus Margulisiibacteriota bacterium]